MSEHCQQASWGEQEKENLHQGKVDLHSQQEPHQQVPKNGDQNDRPEDQELEVLRSRILELFPELRTEVQIMQKNDLMQVLQASGVKKQLEQVPDRRTMMITQIVRCFPEMKKELQEFDEKDIEDIFNALPNQSLADPSKRDADVDEINVTEMKKSLIDRIPGFRNQIRQMPESKIISVYRSLQKQNAEKKAVTFSKPKIEQPTYVQDNRIPQNNHLPEDSFSRLRATGRNTTQVSHDFHEEQNMSANKNERKLNKKKSKCKLTFYLNAQDFEQAGNAISGTQDPTVSLSKIIEALGRAFKKQKLIKE